MKNLNKSLFSLALVLTTILLSSGQVFASVQRTIDITVTNKKGEIEKSAEIITSDEVRFRIDIVDTDRKVTDQTSYIMTVDAGENWIIGDKPKDEFYCAKTPVDDFFKSIGGQVTDAVDFFNVKIGPPILTKLIDEPGPEILGYQTHHIKIETNANGYVKFMFMKFEYLVKVTDDIWYVEEALHPARQKWMNALSHSGNDVIDSMYSDFMAQVPGPVIKQESVVEITDVRKGKTKTKKTAAVTTQIKELTAAEMDKLFIIPECKVMDKDEIKEKASELMSADKMAL